MNSKRKGKCGELEACKALRDVLGIDAKRGQQYSGSPESPDIVTDLDGIHFEVKRVERLNISQALQQACDDAGEGAAPVVLWRKNHGQWVFIAYLDDMPHIARSVMELKK
jgi:Holliday junction resolvase